jgi:flagellar basal body-associated protein FliL
LSGRQQTNKGGCLRILAAVLTVVMLIVTMQAIMFWFAEHPLAFFPFVAVLLVAGYFGIPVLRRRQQARLEAKKERERAEREAEEMRREQERRRIEALLHRDRVRDEINYMSGSEFERFMADLFRQKGYAVQETKATGDQGVDLILPDLDVEQDTLLSL